MKKIVSLLMIVCVLCGGLVSCSKTNEDMIEERIEDFLDAFNDGDLDAMVECLDAKTRTTFESTLGLVGSLTGVSIADIFGIAMGLYSEGDYLGYEIGQIEVVGISAKVDVNILFDNDGEEEAIATVFDMVFENGEWLIQDWNESESPSQDGGNNTNSNNNNNNNNNTGNGGGSNGGNTQGKTLIDPFAGITFNVSGISPYCSVSVNNGGCSADAQRYVTYTFDKDSYRNGETATVTATLSPSALNYALTQTTMTYTVAGMPEYITSVNGIDFSFLESELADYMTAEIASSIGRNYMFGISTYSSANSSGWSYVDSVSPILQNKYFSSLKLIKESKKDYSTPYNRYTFVYRLDYTAHYYENVGTGFMYVCISANNIVKYADGSVKWGMANAEAYDFTHETNTVGLEDCVLRCIMNRSENYNINKVS